MGGGEPRGQPKRVGGRACRHREKRGKKGRGRINQEVPVLRGSADLSKRAEAKEYVGQRDKRRIPPKKTQNLFFDLSTRHNHLNSTTTKGNLKPNKKEKRKLSHKKNRGFVGV